MNRSDQIKNIHLATLDLFNKKNIDYGNAFTKYGIMGVLMEIENKMQSSYSITEKGITLVNGDSMKDILLDAHNYVTSALMLIDGYKNSIDSYTK
jgi:hypothetical protein